GVAQIKMPQLGESVTEGTVEKWLKREGEFVKRDEPIVEVVTDKVNAEIPSPFEGTLVKIDAGEGQVVRVGAVIAQIETAAAAGLDGAREELVKLSVMRRSIADHMVRSLATSPHAWTLQEVDVTNLVRYREAEKDGFRARHGTALTYLPFVAQLLGRALKQFPWLNSTWSDDGVVLTRYLNLGIAVSIPDGLIVPVLKDADQLGFSELVRRIND